MPEWWTALIQVYGPTAVLAGVVVTAVLALRGKRGETNTADRGQEQAAIAERWDDASELATKMREYVAVEVEKQVAPLRSKLERVEREAHEMYDAMRAWVSQLWTWNVLGRHGSMPMPPVEVLRRLGLHHFINTGEPTPDEPRKD